MIARVVAFALHQRFVTLALALLLTAGGIVSFHRLPIEAYPDVADVEVDVIMLWPGHAAEEVERYITMPLEKEVNGIARVTFLRRSRTSACRTSACCSRTAPTTTGRASRCRSASPRPR